MKELLGERRVKSWRTWTGNLVTFSTCWCGSGSEEVPSGAGDLGGRAAWAEIRRYSGKATTCRDCS